MMNVQLQKIFGVGFLIASVLVTGCDKKDEPNNSTDFDQKGMLTNMRTEVITPAYVQMHNSLTQLQTQVSAFTADPTTANLELVQNAFVKAYVGYQSVSSFDFGPASNVVYRAVLNTYPTNSSIIEANIVNGNYNLDAASNLAAIGLPAVDYMLFAQSAQQTVDLFSSDVNSAARAKYLADVVNQMEQLTQTVKTDWETGYGDAFEQNTGTGNGSAPSLLINTMVQDYERYIRDGKVGIPAGVRSLGETFPEKTEGYYAQISNELLVASLEAYQNTFKGGDGLGLDDYLVAENASNTANSIISQLQSSTQKASALPNTMAVAVDANAAEVDELYQSLQQTIATLKVDMPSALSILITYQDSDGD